MEYRVLGRTNLRVSALGFGCGNVGGLMVRGTPAERERAVARALDLGVNFFDTAPLYGDGVSEEHLGADPAGAPGAVPRGDEGPPGSGGARRSGGGRDAVHRHEPPAPPPRSRRPPPAPRPGPVRARRRRAGSGGGSRSDPAGLRDPAPGWQDRLRRDDGHRRYAGRPPGPGGGRGGLGAGVFQPPQPDRRLCRAAGLSGPGLRPPARAHARAGDRGRGDPGAGRRGAVGRADAPPDRGARRRPDRLGSRLRDRREPGPCPPGPRGGGPRGESGRGRASVSAGLGRRVDGAPRLLRASITSRPRRPRWRRARSPRRRSIAWRPAGGTWRGSADPRG